MQALVSDRLRSFEYDHIWVHTNLEDLLVRYPEQWIAVRDLQVIANASDLDALLSRLPDPAHTCVEFVTREPLELIL